jgi:hypothetical protein
MAPDYTERARERKLALARDTLARDTHVWLEARLC